MSIAEARKVALLVVLLTLGYSLVSLFRHWHFDSSFDLAIFDQVIWKMSRFETPESTIRGFPNIFGDHFAPVLALFAPLLWIAPHVETLLIAQAALYALSVVPVFLFFRTRFDAGTTLALCVAYGLFWGIQRANAADLHEMAFAPLVIATLIYAMDQRRWTLFWVSSVLLTLVKEDLVPILVFVGPILFLRGERIKGAIFSVASFAVFLLIVGVIIPAFNPSGSYMYTGAYGEAMRRPWTLPMILVTPAVKLETLFMCLAPFCFLSLRSPIGLLLIPLALERFLSGTPEHWGTSFHYTAPVAPIVALSAGDGLAAVAKSIADPTKRKRTIVALTAVSVLLSSLLPGHLFMWRLLTPDYYKRTAFQDTGYRALATIPADASVVAQSAIAPHLTHRPHIWILVEGAIDADYVIFGNQLSPWPEASIEKMAALIEERRRNGYQTVFDENGWIVLRR